MDWESANIAELALDYHPQEKSKGARPRDNWRRSILQELKEVGYTRERAKTVARNWVSRAYWWTPSAYPPPPPHSSGPTQLGFKRHLKLLVALWVDNDTHFRSFYGHFYCFKETVSVVRKTKDVFTEIKNLRKPPKCNKHRLWGVGCGENVR